MLKKYLLYSTIISLFTEAIYINIGIDLKLFYLIILSNFLILLRLISFRLNHFFLNLLCVITFTSFISILNGDNKLNLFLAQFVGIIICGSYYYMFILYFNNLKLLFYYYLRVALFVCYIGFPIYFINLVLHRDFRFHSILAEPAHYGAIMIPAFYFYYKKYISEKENKKELLIMGLSLLLTESSVTFIGIILVLILSNKIKFSKLIWPSILILVFGFGAYTYNENIKMRVDDTLSGLINFNVEGVNLSSYALISNMYVARKNIENNPIIGTGLGSFELAHDKYIKSLKGVDYMEQRDDGVLVGLNKKDANSLFLRVSGEFGLLGIFIILFFIFKNRINISADLMIYSNAVLCYVILKFFREGHYFSPEMWFFFTFYYLIPKIKKKNETRYISSYSYSG